MWSSADFRLDAQTSTRMIRRRWPSAPSPAGKPPASKTGQLEAGIAAFRGKAPKGVAIHRVGVRGKRQKYANTAQNRRLRRVGKTFQQDTRNSKVARFLEFGTAKMSARPFVKPAFERNVSAAIDAIKDRLAKAVEDAATK